MLHRIWPGFRARQIWLTSTPHNWGSLIQSHRLRHSLPDKASTLQKFDFPVANTTIKAIRQRKAPPIVTLNGHLNHKPRVRPGRTFVELRDADGGIIQLLLNKETPLQYFELLRGCKTEDSISVTGTTQKRYRADQSEDVEVVVDHIQVLSTSNLDAARLDKLKHTAPALIPPRFRYLQLRTPKFQRALRQRNRAAIEVRRVLESHDFVEIETPLLFKSTPEGANEFLVPTRTANSFYALPQSPQQYKQILMSSGFTKYYQIARCFRDEDLRADRQPEFTQVDLEMSYVASSDQVGVVVEDVVHNVWRNVGKVPTYTVKDGILEEVNLQPGQLHFSKLTYTDALSKFGIDKPDMRSSLEIVNLSQYFESDHPDFPVVEALVLKGVGKPSRVLLDSNNYTRRKPITIPIKLDEDASSWYRRFCDKNILKQRDTFDEGQLRQLLGLEVGDALAFSTRAAFSYENPTPLGKFRQLAIAEYPNRFNRPMRTAKGLVTDYDASRVVVGSWVVDFPLFNPVETSEPTAPHPEYDFTRMESTHHPFTMAKTEDYDLLASDPLSVRGEHYDLVINGVEVGGGSRRIHDADLQRYVFESILQISNYQALFGHLLRALSMGCPPHAGLALGFDRLCAMLIGSSSIRDVIAFPKNQSGVDPVVQSPTDVPDKTLEKYHIKRGD